MEEVRHHQLIRSVRDFKVNGGTPSMANVIIFRLESYVNEKQDRITHLKSLPHQTRSVLHKIAHTTFHRNMAWMQLKSMRKRMRRYRLVLEEENE